MNDLNSLLLEAYLTNDPERSYTPKGTAVCRFTVASSRRYKQDGQQIEEVGHFDVETWDRLAETCAEHLKKGRGVRVIGRLKQDRWQQNGRSRSRVVIVAEHIEIRSKTKTNTDEVAHAV